MRCVSVLAVALALALPGCTQENLAPPVAEEPDDCVVWSEPWTATLSLGARTYYVGTPMGGMGGGNTHPLPLNELHRPLRIRFTAEWDAANPLYFDSIEVEFWIYEDGRISEQPRFEGTSPVRGEFELLDLAIENSPSISFGAPRNYTGPATVQVAPVDHPITFTMEMLHPCERESRPGQAS
jgi:hypothetical protein